MENVIDLDDYTREENRVRAYIKEVFKDEVPDFSFLNEEWQDRLLLLEAAFSYNSYYKLDVFHGESPENYYQLVKFYLWYFDLGAFPLASLPYIVSHLMVSLLNEYPGETRMLVNFLNVDTMYSAGKHKSLEDLGHTSSVVRDLAQYKQGKFVSFTREQRYAFIEWLTLARTWEELEYDLIEVDAALSYWRNVLKNIEN